MDNNSNSIHCRFLLFFPSVLFQFHLLPSWINALAFHDLLLPLREPPLVRSVDPVRRAHDGGKPGSHSRHPGEPQHGAGQPAAPGGGGAPERAHPRRPGALRLREPPEQRQAAPRRHVDGLLHVLRGGLLRRGDHPGRALPRRDVRALGGRAAAHPGERVLGARAQPPRRGPAQEAAAAARPPDVPRATGRPAATPATGPPSGRSGRSMCSRRRPRSPR